MKIVLGSARDGTGLALQAFLACGQHALGQIDHAYKVGDMTNLMGNVSQVIDDCFGDG